MSQSMPESDDDDDAKAVEAGGVSIVLLRAKDSLPVLRRYGPEDHQRACLAPVAQGLRASLPGR
jgi:hypothetical protein